MEGSQNAFTSEEICEQAKGNVGALSLLLLAYARGSRTTAGRGRPVHGWRLAPGSGPGARRADAWTAARWAALNMVSGGGELRWLDGDARQAAAVVGRWPLDEDLAFFGLSQQEADTFYDLFTPIAERLGLAYTWRRNGDDLGHAQLLSRRRIRGCRYRGGVGACGDQWPHESEGKSYKS